MLNESYSAMSNVTTYQLSNVTRSIPSASVETAMTDADWYCDNASMRVPEMPPWTVVQVGHVIITEYNATELSDFFAAHGDNASTCDALYRKVINVSGAGSGSLWFNTSDAMLEDMFDDFEVEFPNMLFNGVVMETGGTVVTSNETIDEPWQSSRRRCLGISGNVDVPINFKFEVNRTIGDTDTLVVGVCSLEYCI